MNDNSQRETSVDHLVRNLSREIVEGVLRPGARLDEQGLARRFDVSRTPVREALARLASSGLVERRPHRGVIVASPSAARLASLFELMCELEGVCARLAALRLSADELAALDRLHHASQALAEAGDASGYADVNRDFHAAIYAGAHNEPLVESTQETRRRLAPFRRAQFNLEGRPDLSWREHERIMAALRARDGDAAGAAMREHIQIVREAYESYAGAVAPSRRSVAV